MTQNEVGIKISVDGKDAIVEVSRIKNAFDVLDASTKNVGSKRTDAFAQAAQVQLKAIAAQTRQAGNDVTTGLKNGLTAGVGGVLQSARNLASKLIASVKSVLGIRSPSTVFFTIGQNIVEGLSNGIASIAGGLGALISAPLLALGGFAVKSAFSLDTVRQKLVGLEGSADAANARIKDLQKFSQNTKGVTFDLAATIYQSSKPLGIGEAIIKKETAALGKLGQDGDFARNLLQIFQQGFERSDIKEAIGRVPLFEQILGEVGKKFNVSDVAGLKKLKDSGKLSVDQFLEGFSDAVNNNPIFANAGESFSTKLAKLRERVEFALAPLGEKIIDRIAPYIDKGIDFIERLSSAFDKLSPSTQDLVITVGAIAIGIAPAVIALGALAGAGITLISAFAGIAGAVAAVGGLSVAIPIIAGVAVELALLAGGAVLLYEAWQTNFGGIRDFAISSYNSIKSATSVFLNFLDTQIGAGITDIIKFVTENYGAVSTTIAAISETVKSTINGALSLATAFWQRHGEQITAVVESAYNLVKTYIYGAFEQAKNVFALIGQIVNGDWAGAWESFKNIVYTAFKNTTALLVGGIGLIGKYLAYLGSVIANEGATAFGFLIKTAAFAVSQAVYFFATLPAQIVKYAPQIVSAAFQIGGAIISGIKDGILGTDSRAAIGDVITGGLSDSAKNVPKFTDYFSQIYDGAKSYLPDFTKANDEANKSLLNTGSAAKTAAGGLGLSADQTKKVTELIKDLGFQIKFFGQDTQVAATKQQLLKDGIENLNDPLAKQALALAAQVDQLKKTSQAEKERADKLKSFREELTKTRENANFELRFPNATDLNKFNESVRTGAGNFKELRGEIEQTRIELESLEKIKLSLASYDTANEAISALSEKVAGLRTESSGAADLMKTLFDLGNGLGIKGGSGAFVAGVESYELSQAENFAEKIQDYYAKINQLRNQAAIADNPAIANANVVAIQRLNDEAANYLTTITTINKEGKTVSIFPQDAGGIATAKEYLNLLTNLLDTEQKRKRVASDKTFSDTLADLNAKTRESASVSEQARIAKLLETDAYKQLNDAQRNQLLTKAREADIYSISKPLDGQLEDLRRNGIEITSVEQTTKSIKDLESAYGSLSDFEKNELLNKARLIDAQKLLNEQQSKVRNFVGESLKTLSESGFKGFFTSIKDKFKQMLLDMATEFLTSKILKLLTGQSNASGSGNSSGGGFGGLGSLIGSIFGGRIGGGGNSSVLGSIIGANGQPINVGNNFSGSSANGGGTFAQIVNARAATSGDSSASGLSGNLAGIGAIASVLGGALGGRAGGLLSGAGSGLAIGAQIGSIVPGIGTVIGAGVGAAVGFFASLFGGDKNKKLDKKENIPALQKGFGDAITQMNAIVSQVKAVNLGNAAGFNADDVLKQVADLRGQIVSGFGIDFKSSKYKKEAQNQISAKLREFDALNVELQTAIAAARLKKEEADSADERTRRLIPEFATGTYASAEFIRRNGQLYGGVSGRDSLPSLLMPGELVLNQYQQQIIRRNSGFDVFATAQIPNYSVSQTPRIEPVKPVRMATGGFVGGSSAQSNGGNNSANQSINVSVGDLVLKDFTPGPNAEAWLETPQGERKIFSIVNNGIENGEVGKGKRRK